MSVSELQVEQRLTAALRATADWVATGEPVTAVAASAAIEHSTVSMDEAQEILIQLVPEHGSGRDRSRRGGPWAWVAGVAAVACAITGFVTALVLSGPAGTVRREPAGGSGHEGVPAATSSVAAPSFAASSFAASGSASGPDYAESSAASSGSPVVSPSLGCGYSVACGTTAIPEGSAGVSSSGAAGSTGSTP